MKIQFGDLPVNLRQLVLDLVRDRNIIGPEITIAGVSALSPELAAHPHNDATGHSHKEVPGGEDITGYHTYDLDPDSNGFH